ncbi:hypothetical protein GH714_005477 [Hevea brasiliensis]|uniref:FPL domain-containing protein n=1 Tax=Hevea brasiliensis TaxID=3981 RepID=A0A6A6M823_HEVBR|nr:hypothetical protein GH714_005477 [Hevea brasiliensis]
MWLSFWRSRDRFSLDELRYLTDQLQKVQIVNEVNKDFVIEALRSMAELITYGDQHDSNYFEYFMEKQVMGEFVRILKISRSVTVSLQLLQTISIMIQNLKSEHAIYYMFSNEHINFLITYTFDFHNEELLSYYISFLRAISGKLNRNTISLLVKTHNEVVVSFPLYVEATRFAFHEENMIRTAQCIDLNALVSKVLKNSDPDGTTMILVAVDEIEDNLYYFSDVISAGIPDVGRLITDKMLQFLIIPFLLPSLRLDVVNEQIGAITSLYLLCCILRIVKIKDLANTIAAALFCPAEVFIPKSEAKLNGHVSGHSYMNEIQQSERENVTEVDACPIASLPALAGSSQVHPEGATQNDFVSSHGPLRDVLLSYITNGNDLQVLGSLSVLATLLQTKELDETMLDALGILPQRKQHKKLLLQALVGEGSGEDQLFASEFGSIRDSFSSDLDVYLQKLKEQFGVVCYFPEVGTSPRVHRFQDSYKNCTGALLEETRGSWPDLLETVLCDEWKKCKRAVEASSPRKEPKCILMPLQKSSYDDSIPSESSIFAGERMCELVKVCVLLLQLQIFSLGRALPEQPPIYLPTDLAENSRARTAGLDVLGPKPGVELRLVDAVPCRIAFERGKERHFCFLAVSMGTSGWILLIEELPLKQHHGVVRIIAPLAGCKPRIDDKHSRWLHLCIRPSSLPFVDPAKSVTSRKMNRKALVDGRWTLAFRNEESCKIALSMILEEISQQSSEVERRLRPLLEFQGDLDTSIQSPLHSEALSASATPSNSL